MQPLSDLALLQQWQHHQDAHAFKALTQRYGGLVFGICNRVLKNAADAEEITQDCFLKLAQHPEKIDRSLGPWLHSVAVNAAISRIRSEQRRRTRESAHESTRPQATEYSAQDLFEHVDEAISQLADAQRFCVVGYFLEGKPRHDVAAVLGVSTKTVQRKTDEAIAKIREILSQRGITTSAGALAITMAGLKAEALPPALGVALGKIAVAGHTGAAVGAVAVQATTSGGTGMIKSVGILVAGIALISCAVWWNSTGARTAAAPEIATQASATAASVAEPEIVAPAATPSAPANLAVESIAADPALPESSFALGGTLAEAIVPIANPTRYAALRGLVTDASERPIAGARVTLLVAGVSLDELASLQVEGFPPAASLANDTLETRRTEAARDALFALSDHRYTAETDEFGQFLIEGIRYKGHAMVGVEADNFALTHQSLDVEENATANVKLALTPGKVLLGKLVTPSGEPVVDARIGVYSVKVTAPDPIPAMELRGDSSKSTRKGGSSSGSGEGGSARASGRASSSGGSGGAGGAGGAGGGGGIGGGGGGGFGGGGFAMGSGGNVSLGAVNRPAIIPAFLPRTDESGHFSVTAAAAGGKIAVSLVADSATHGTATFMEVPVGSDEVVVLDWKNGVSAIDGQILLSNGEPAKGHYVHLRGTIPGGVQGDGQSPQFNGVSGSEFFLATDGDGRFHRAGIASHEAFIATIYDSAGRKRGSVDLPAFEQGETLTWSHTLSPPLKVTGTVTGVPSGKPIVRALVNIRALSAPQSGDWDMEQVTTNALGVFTLDVAGEEGKYIVNATVSPWWDEKAGTEVALRYDASVELSMEIPDPWERTFRLVEPDGSPVAGVAIRLEQAIAGGARAQNFLKDVTSDREGRVTLKNLAPDNLTMARFSLEGYLDGKSTERGGTAGERCAEEVVTLYPRTGFAARLMDEAGQPYADRDAVILARYGNGEETIHTVATDGEGWLLLSRHLPATTVDLEIHLMEAQEPNPNLAMANYGPMPDHYRLEVLRQTLRAATAAHMPHATVAELRLEEDGENEIGDLVLKADAYPGEE